PQFRQLVRCLNAYGALEPLEKLTDQLNDEELQPLIDVTNRYLLKNPRRIRELDRTLEHLTEAERLDPLLESLGGVLGNGRFVSATVSMLRNSYRSPEKPRILATLERLSTRLEPSRLGGYLDAGLTV